VTSNNRFERSRGSVFGGTGSKSMIGINQLRFSLAQPRVAQPHRRFWTRASHWFIVSAMSNSVVSVSPDVMSGAPVFAGTRVPVQTLLEYLEAGDSIDEFLAGFPSVSRSQVIAFLKRATTLAVTDAA
jgi:uncharacterized protein (DUF433 family)